MQIVLRLFIVGIIFAVTACSHASSVVPIQGQSSSRETPHLYQAIPNVFAAARGKVLTQADIDKYIDPSITGNDRKLAEYFMRLMPTNIRGDFVYHDANGRLLSNNPALLHYVQVENVHASPPGHRQPPRLTAATIASVVATSRAASGGTRRMMDYSSSCSPPNPPSTPQGAYVRQVSQCGFTAGFAFVNVPCGYSYFASNDAGHLYMELQGASGSLTEGGLEWYNDLDVAPYLRTPNGYVQMNNNSVRYSCGMDLGILHGATQSGYYTYTAVGQVPPSCTPETMFCNGNEFTFIGESWLFEPSAGDITGMGYDNVGIITPCVTCSISRVTSIAQNGVQSYSIDGSYFGINFNTGQNMINWMQVAFGEWEDNCEPGTSLCTGVYSGQPGYYYGGPQYYPNDIVSESDLNPNTGFGPYESFDSIDLSCGGCTTANSAHGPFAEALPPYYWRQQNFHDPGYYGANGPVTANWTDWMVSLDGGAYQAYCTISGTYQDGGVQSLPGNCDNNAYTQEPTEPYPGDMGY